MKKPAQVRMCQEEYDSFMLKIKELVKDITRITFAEDAIFMLRELGAEVEDALDEIDRNINGPDD